MHFLFGLNSLFKLLLQLLLLSKYSGNVERAASDKPPFFFPPHSVSF